MRAAADGVRGEPHNEEIRARVAELVAEINHVEHEATRYGVRGEAGADDELRAQADAAPANIERRRSYYSHRPPLSIP